MNSKEYIENKKAYDNEMRIRAYADTFAKRIRRVDGLYKQIATEVIREKAARIGIANLEDGWLDGSIMEETEARIVHLQNLERAASNNEDSKKHR